MSPPVRFHEIRNHPHFNELVRRRRRFVTWLTMATLIPYYAFIFTAIFNPQLLGAKIADTSIVNVAWPICVGLIVVTWALTGLYIRRANGEFEELTRKIRLETEK